MPQGQCTRYTSPSSPPSLPSEALPESSWLSGLPPGSLYRRRSYIPAHPSQAALAFYKVKHRFLPSSQVCALWRCGHYSSFWQKNVRCYELTLQSPSGIQRSQWLKQPMHELSNCLDQQRGKTSWYKVYSIRPQARCPGLMLLVLRVRAGGAAAAIVPLCKPQNGMEHW